MKDMWYENLDKSNITKSELTALSDALFKAVDDTEVQKAINDADAMITKQQENPYTQLLDGIYKDKKDRKLARKLANLNKILDDMQQ